MKALQKAFILAAIAYLVHAFRQFLKNRSLSGKTVLIAGTARNQIHHFARRGVARIILWDTDVEFMDVVVKDLTQNYGIQVIVARVDVSDKQCLAKAKKALKCTVDILALDKRDRRAYDEVDLTIADVAKCADIALEFPAQDLRISREESPARSTPISATNENFDPKGFYAAKADRAAEIFEDKFDPATSVRCRHCWFTKIGCICLNVPPSLCTPLPFETIVVMHPSEIIRASSRNTSKLLLWWGARRCIYGQKEDMGILAHRFSTTRCAILFPSDDAVPPDSSAIDVDTVVILDGGWSAARSMNRGLNAAITRWKLNLNRDEGYGRTRKYNGGPESRAQTGHAYCELLRTLRIDDNLVDQMAAGVLFSASEVARQNGWCTHNKECHIPRDA